MRGDLEASRVALTRAQARFSAGDAQGANRQLRTSQRNSGRAASRSQSLLWKAYARLPVVGPGVREVQALATALDVTNRSVLPPLLSADFQPSSWKGRADLAPFVAAQGPLRKAESGLEAVRSTLDRAPRSGVGLVHTARRRLETELARLSDVVSEASVAADTVPRLLGGSKTYLLAVQNNAEQRATGGLLGAYGVLHVHDGAMQLTQVGPNQDLVDAPTPVIELGQEYDDRYGRFQSTRVWRSANLTPDTPTAARTWAALWKSRTGVALDGVILIDPVGLARLLGATGPVNLDDGTRLSEQNAVALLLVKAYEKFPVTADAERNGYLQQAARASFAALTHRVLGARTIARAVAAAVSEGHLQAWSADPSVESRLVRSRVGGSLSAAGPFLEVVTQDVGGSKLGYYLKRAVTYVAAPTGAAVDLGAGPRPEEEATVSLTMTNTAPFALPPYVTIRADDPLAPRGQLKSWVSVYLGKGATLQAATLDGRPVALESDTEKGLSVFSTYVSVGRRQARRLVLHVRQPAAGAEPLLYRQQPLVMNDELHIGRGLGGFVTVYRR